MNEFCKADGCNNLAQRCGYCRKHYEIALHGCVKKRCVSKTDTKCIVKECCNQAFRRGYCSKHYKQILKCGEIHKTEFEIKSEMAKDRNALIIKDLKDGMTRKDVSDKYSLTNAQVKYIVEKSGEADLKIATVSLTDEQIRQKLIDNKLQFEYAGEYKRGKSVLLSCKCCGKVNRYSSTVIYKNHLECRDCKQTNLYLRQHQAEIEKAERKIAREQAKAEENKRKEALHESKRRDLICPICGKSFVTYNPRKITCSSECSRKRENKLSSRKFDKRISKDKRIDRITLDELFIRDNGVCHICGKQCKWNDHTTDGIDFIAGNNYPSIDHVIPIAKGGTDSWDNVKLAHRRCNSIKRDRV